KKASSTKDLKCM
ncbi:flagellar hook-associated protein 3, partial [Vibrio parahaemolyticus V-223/04]